MLVGLIKAALKPAVAKHATKLVVNRHVKITTRQAFQAVAEALEGRTGKETRPHRQTSIIASDAVKEARLLACLRQV